MKTQQGQSQPIEGARKASWQILLAWETGGEALVALRDDYFRRADPDPRDRALITELTQGTVRYLLSLDHTIQNNLDRPDLSLPLPVTTALRLGAYQLIYLHRIPPHAAVKETVQIIKDSRYRRFSALVNAVLRKISRKGPSPIPTQEADPMRHMELATSSPRWLVEHLIGSCGKERTMQVLQALNRTPPLTLRVNTSRISREKLMEEFHRQGIEVSPGKLSMTAVRLEERTAPGELKPFKEGLCTVQDEGAQLIAGLLTPGPGLKILDACAAPGGKTGHLAQSMEGRGLIVAADRSHKRLRMMSDNLTRLGTAGVQMLAADLTATSSPFQGNVFDRVLLDAPCSGTGVLRRHPEGKWKKDPATISRMILDQEDLLISAFRTLKKSGRLLYTTCSLLKEENEDVVDRFFDQYDNVAHLDLREVFPDMRLDVFNARGDLRLWPDVHDCDGFYACLMEKVK